MDVTFNSSGLAPGEYQNTLVITSDDPDQPSISLSVIFTVLAPDIEVTAPPLMMELLPGQSGNLNFIIANIGTLALHWSLTESPSVLWLSEAPISGTIIPEGSNQVDVTFNSAGLSLGEYHTSIIITSDDLDAPSIPLSVTLRVIEEHYTYLSVIMK